MTIKKETCLFFDIRGFFKISVFKILSTDCIMINERKSLDTVCISVLSSPIFKFWDVSWSYQGRLVKPLDSVIHSIH